jgi:hypothetical protein
MPGPFASGADTYAGFIDSPTNGIRVFSTGTIQLKGWVVDQSAQGWAGIDQIDVYDGRADAGGKFLGSASIAQVREDVARGFNNGYWLNSGFSMTINANNLAGSGNRTLAVYAHTPNKGWWFKEVTVQRTASVSQSPFPQDPTVVIQGPDSDERVPTNEDYKLNGYAIDRNATGVTNNAGIARVQIYLDGQRGTGVLLGEATINLPNGESGTYGSQFGSGGWEFTISPTKISSEKHTIYVYALSAVTGAENFVARTFEIYDPQ